MRNRIIGALLLCLLAACGATPQGAAPTAPAAAPTAPASALTDTAAVPTDAIAAVPTDAPSGSGAQLVVMTHDSFSVSDDVLKAFEQQNNVSVQVLKSGDAGAMLNKAILSKNTPLADVMYGVDNTFLSRALQADILEPYAAPALQAISSTYKLDSSNRLLPIDYGFVSINYDKAYLTQNKLQVPQDLRELTKPEWKGKLVVENPATSSTGLAFMLATIGQFGTQGAYTWLDYWKDLRANDVYVSEGWTDAYNTQFSGASGKGPRPLVVSYASSPPAEVYYSEGKITEPPTGAMLPGSFLQVEFAGVLKDSKQPQLAQRFIDFMQSKAFQEDMPLQMFVYPVLPGAALPDVFQKFSQTPVQTATVAPDQIEANRDQWLDAWNSAVLR